MWYDPYPYCEVSMYYVIRIDTDDYVVRRGGLDWGRVESRLCASRFETREDAQRFASWVIPDSMFRGIEEVDEY